MGTSTTLYEKTMRAGVAASTKNYLCYFRPVCIHQREKLVCVCGQQSRKMERILLQNEKLTIQIKLSA